MENNKTKDDNKLINRMSNQDFKTSNPIDNPRIMPLNTRTSANRLYSGYTHSNNKITDINYNEIINTLNSTFINQTDPISLFYLIHNQVCSKIGINFSALGIYNQNSNYINVKLIDKTGSSYNSMIMLNDDNVVARAFESKQIITTTDSSYLKLNYLSNISNLPTNIIPLNALGECLEVIIF